MRAIPIDVVRAFVAVVEARGFTRAAEDLGRSQPTVSLQVGRLEKLVEAPLFENAARFELTTVGSVCFDYGRRLLKLHDEMLEAGGAPQGARCDAAGRHAGRVRPRTDAPTSRACSPRRAAQGSRWSRANRMRWAAAFRQNALDVALLVGGEPEEEEAGRWRAPLGWYEADGEEELQKPLRPLTGSGLSEQGWPFGSHAPDGKAQPAKPLRLVVSAAGIGAARGGGRRPASRRTPVRYRVRERRLRRPKRSRRGRSGRRADDRRPRAGRGLALRQSASAGPAPSSKCRSSRAERR